VLGKLTGLVLRVDESAVDLHIKNPSAAFDEFRDDPGGCFDCVRQTGGFGRVVSLNAVSNADLHFWTPSTDDAKPNDSGNTNPR